ncbi:MAG: gamma-glutamyltransferase [candidate division Zixibacteria bacterium]
MRRSLITTLILLSLVSGCSDLTISRYFEVGALATVAPIATDIGVKVFSDGGNAYDVTVAVGFALAVVHPQAGNLGGGGFALIRDGDSKKISALDFRETAPQLATQDMYLDDSSEVIDNLSTEGALAAGVPGSVAGLFAIWQAGALLPWSNLVTRSAELADSGFIIDEYLAASIAEYADDLKIFQETAALFAPGGNLLQAGDRLILPDLARTLHKIAAEGTDGFYGGEVAAAIEQTMLSHGGLIRTTDLSQYQPIWREPVHFQFDSLDIYSMSPPSSGGLIVGQILKLLEPYDFTSISSDSPEYMHLFCEASRLAFADRSKHLGDPDFYNVPDALLDTNYLNQRRLLISAEHAGNSETTEPGHPLQLESDQTTHFSVCDGQGNMISITTTLNTGFGSKLVVGGAGFLLNNEMDDFAIKPGYPNTYGLIGAEANKIEPGKRMLSSMSPTIVMRNGQPLLILGSPGGSKIITTVANAIINYTRFNLPLEKVASQPRFHHQWLPDKIYLEEGSYGVATMQRLIRYGHDVTERERYSDLQMISVEQAGLMLPVSDPRNGGKASGY